MTTGIPLQVPALPRDAQRGYLALGVRSPVDETAVINTCKLPFCQRHNGEYQVHVSSIATLAKWGLVSLAGSNAAALEAVRRYAREARRTYDPAALNALPADANDFLSLFSADYTPRPYQLAGMSRLYARLIDPTIGGCVLADDVGLGKTVQTIGVVLRLIQNGYIERHRRFAIVATASTVTQWAAECKRFSRPNSHLQVASVAAGTTRQKLAALDDHRTIYILSYETLRLPQFRPAIERLAPCLGGVAFDESSALANPSSKTHEAAFLFSRTARHRLCLNATPIENAFQDYYAQLRILNNRIVGEPEGFIGRYLRVEGGRVRETLHIKEFVTRTAALYIRRTAESVGEQLPPLTAQLRTVLMGKVQAEAYDRAIRQCFAVRGAASGVMSVENVSAIQRAAFSANLSDPTAPSAKLEDLARLLATELRGRRVLVFTRLATIARAVALYLARRLPAQPFLVTGETSQPERDRIIAAYSAAPAPAATPPPVLVCTDALSKGKNIQAASVVVNLDLPWHPGKLRQRVGRSHRIGQEKPVLVINYRARHPHKKRDVDQFFIDLHDKKTDIVEQTFGKDGVDVMGKTSDAAVARRVLSYLTGK